MCMLYRFNVSLGKYERRTANMIHSAVSKFIDDSLVYYHASFASQNFDTEAIWAMIIGISLGVIILSFLTAFPGG